MTTDLEADLRREFNAARMPDGLTFHAESVLRQGNRTIRRRRIIAAGSAGMAVAGFISGHVQVQFNRDVRVQPNVHYFFVTQDGRRHEVGSSSTGKPGQKPDAVWRSGIYGGHPVTIGLVPNPEYGSLTTLPTITFADGGSYGVGGAERHRLFHVLRRLHAHAG